MLALAILHPRRVGVYVVEGVGGNGMAASYFKLTQRYEHLLGVDGEHFTAFNMIHGPFGASSAGGARDRDHLCVQSLDGRLQFFEQDRLAFIQPLNQSLVPGVLCYAPGMDAVIAETSDLQIECYRYQVLAQASMKKRSNKLGDQDDEDGSDAAARSKQTAIHSDWKLNLGEALVDIRVGRCYYQENVTSFDIIALGEFTLFGIKPHGEVFLQKRLGFHPSAMCVFRRPAPANDRVASSLGGAAGDSSAYLENLLVASHSKLWSVYKDKALVWSACPSTVPVALQVAEFGGIDGMIVSLDSSGLLSVNYMGTDPPSTAVVSPDTKELSYEEMDEEHRQLLNVIRRSQGERRSEPKDRLLLRAQVPAILDAVSSTDGRRDDFQRSYGAPSPTNDSGSIARGTQLTMRVYVAYTGASRLSNVTLSVSTPPNIIASETSIVIEGIDGRGSSTPLIIPIVLRPSSRVMPTSLNVAVLAAYTLESGQPRVSQCVVRLPMCVMCRLVPPVKSSTFKFTLETNQEPLELSSLFEGMFHQPFCTPEWAKQVVGNGGGGTNVLSFQYYNGVEATILVSKNAGRYPIQANELEALWMVSNELVQRLRAHYDARQHQQRADAKLGSDDAANEGEGLEVFYQEPLPLADFFATIDMHFALRREKLELAAEMNDRAHQFRVIQKRLLVRYKDRNPAPVNCLDALLHGTYDQLIALSHRVEDVTARLSLAANRLSCCVHLVLMLIAFRFHLSDEDAQLLGCYLSPNVAEDGGNGSSDGIGGGDQGWEERTDSAMTELLRTVLAKQQQQQQQAKEGASAAATELQLADDTKKLKKHIMIVCDRLAKGATLVPAPGTTAAASASESKGDK